MSQDKGFLTEDKFSRVTFVGESEAFHRQEKTR
jgi:hypothetical protein